MSIEKRGPSRRGISGLVFVGFLMIALALGLMYGNLAPYLLGGLGLAFIGMAFARYVTGEW